MEIQKKIANKIKGKKGIGTLLSVLLGIVCIGVLVFPITKWYMAMRAGMSNTAEEFKAIAIIEDYWQQLNSASPEEFQAMMDSLGAGKTKTETIGDYKLQIKFGSQGKYENGVCTTTVPADEDRKCVPATISLTNTAGLIKPITLSVTKVFSKEELESRGLTLDYSKAECAYQKNMAIKIGDSYYGNNIANTNIINLTTNTKESTHFTAKRDGLYQFIFNSSKDVSMKINGQTILFWESSSTSAFERIQFPAFLLKGDNVALDLRNTSAGSDHIVIITFVPYKNSGSIS